MADLEFEQEKEKEQIVTPIQAESTLDSDDIDDDIEVPAEDQQLDLFGELEETPKKKEKTPAKKATPKATSKPKEDEKVGPDYTVYYAGHRIAVPNNDMTLEDIRALLEMDFPELSKERTEMTLDKKEKQIVPVVKGAKKG